MGDFLRALSLLTRLPVRARWGEDVLPGRAMAAYPLVGAADRRTAGRFGVAAHHGDRAAARDGRRLGDGVIAIAGRRVDPGRLGCAHRDAASGRLGRLLRRTGGPPQPRAAAGGDEGSPAGQLWRRRPDPAATGQTGGGRRSIDANGRPSAGRAAAAPGRPRPKSLGRRDRRSVIPPGAARWHGRQLSSRTGSSRGHPCHADRGRRVRH